MSRRRIRTDRLAILAGVVVLAIAVGLYFVIQRGKLGDTRLASDKTLLSLLTVTIVGLLLGLIVVGVRNLARILAGKRKGILGSRLQARVTVAFLLLVLVPSITLFVGAIAIVRRTLSDLAPPDTTVAASHIVEYTNQLLERDVRHVARELATGLAAGPLARAPQPSRGELARWLDDARRRFDLDAVGLVPATGSPIGVAAARREGSQAARPTELTRLPDGLAAAVFANRAAMMSTDSLAFGLRVLAAEPVVVGGDVRAVAWVAIYVPEERAQDLAQVARAGAAWQDMGRNRVVVERLYVTLFALLTIVVLFAAVWAGFLIARQVTDPILDLARGTEALARGELSYRVTERSSDEIGRLASSFNRMAREIERNRTALENRRHYIETLLESIPVGVLSLDATGRVTTVNRTGLDLLRLDDFAPGTALDEWLGAEREAVARAIAPVLRGETTRAHSEQSITVREGQLSLMVSANRFPVGAHEEGVLVVLEDLTRLRRAERLAAWGEVARRLAHEIKNPLTPIRLSAERMLRRFRKGQDGFAPVIEEGVTTIVREVESIQGLVSEFSRFARLPEIRPRPGSLAAVVGEGVALYRGSHPDVRFEVELAAELPLHWIDPEAMRRVLINLLDNAVAAMAGRDGAIRVRAYSNPLHHAVVLEVADNGPGIPPEDRKRLFQPDFTRRPGGTGLGLAIVEQIVIEHGGRIRVEDNPGGGTRLIIELPVYGQAGAPNDVEARGESQRPA